MDQAQALAVVRSLANGVDPESGEVFPCQEGRGAGVGHRQATPNCGGRTPARASFLLPTAVRPRLHYRGVYLPPARHSRF